MGKKFLSIILIAMLMFSVVPTSVFAADSSDFVIEFSSVENVTPGQTFTVDVMIAQNPGVCGFDFPIEYDDALILEKTEVASVDDMTITGKTTIVGESNDEMANSDYTGLIATLTFTASESATTGEYTVTTNNMTAYDADLEDLTWDVIPGVITITAPEVVAYGVTVKNGTADKATAEAGEKVTITANAAPEGQEFDKWTGDVEFADANAEETTFNMPASDVTVTANYKDKDEEKPAVEKVTVSFDANGGSGTMAAETVEKGSIYTLPACGFTAPAEKEFKAWEVNGKEYKAADKITVTADTTVKAIWAAVQNPATPKYNVVVTNGTGDGSYAAGQIVTITADSKSGYTFKEWNVVNGNVTPDNKAAKTTTFEMPAEAVEVEATYTKNSSSGGSSGGGSSSSGSSGSSGSSSSSSGGAAVVTKPDTTIILTIDKLVSTVNGQEIISDVAPIIVDGRTYTPARFVAEQLGAKVDWNEETQLVTVTGKDGVVIELRIGSNVALVNGKPVQMDAAAFIQDSRTYTPARFVAEQLGAKVDWDDTTRQVTITKTK